MKMYLTALALTGTLMTASAFACPQQMDPTMPGMAGMAGMPNDARPADTLGVGSSG
jgi:Cu(I)/Ag(I) efflux system protein CusF